MQPVSQNWNPRLQLEGGSKQLLSWYEKYVRSFLEDVSPEKISEFNDQKRRLETSLDLLRQDRVVCFLGNSGVGKSTLINALVGQGKTLLPQGGIGPLTAQATEVHYSDTEYLRATYLSGRELNQLAFALDRRCQSLTRAGDVAESEESGDAQIDDERRRELEEDAAEEANSPTGRIEAYIKQARLLVRGDQNVELDLPYLVDCLRSALGQKSKWNSELTPDDARRVARLRDCLALASKKKEFTLAVGSDRRAFNEELRNHVSGFLAPLIKTLKVGWPAQILNGGLVLVDLPGLGVANDQYRNVTYEWVRERARGITLVVDRSGVKEAEADLLRSSGFLGRLLHAADDPLSDPVDLVLVIVKVDSSADDAWRQERDLDPVTARKWPVHFEEARAAARELARRQITEQLQAFASQRSEGARQDVQSVIDTTLSRLRVHAVSAPQYVKFLIEDEEDRPRISSLEESGVPDLAVCLEGIADQQTASLVARVEEQSTALLSGLSAHLQLLAAQWEGDERAEAEAEQLRNELDEFIQPKRRDLLSRQGAFREFLKETVPVEIERLVEKASRDAEEAIRQYLRSLGDVHWATLRATVRRGGAFVGSRHIDIPVEFSLRFEEPVALAWSKGVLAKLRKRTSELGSDYIEHVEEVAKWADQQGKRVAPKVVEALRDQMKSDMKQLAEVGKEAVSELRDKVRGDLLNKIQPVIRRRCQRFVDDMQDRGSGTKRRILDFFDDLVPAVTNSAREAATSILRDNYLEVEQEVRKALRMYEHPLEKARDAIVASHEQRIRRSDAQKRKQVLESLALISSRRPAGDPIAAVDVDG